MGNALWVLWWIAFGTVWSGFVFLVGWTIRKKLDDIAFQNLAALRAGEIWGMLEGQGKIAERPRRPDTPGDSGKLTTAVSRENPGRTAVNGLWYPGKPEETKEV